MNHSSGSEPQSTISVSEVCIFLAVLSSLSGHSLFDTTNLDSEVQINNSYLYSVRNVICLNLNIISLRISSND